QDRPARPAIDRSRAMALPEGVLNQQHVAAPEAPPLAVRHLDLDLTVEQDDVLPPGRPVPVVIVRRRILPKDDLMRRNALGQPPDLAGVVQGHRYLVKVRGAVRG